MADREQVRRHTGRAARDDAEARAVWSTEHDWRKCETKINALPNFITEIDGLDIHFIHVKSTHEHALPIVITHGWPGSIIEQLKVIEPLTDPTAHGSTEADAFHVVIPSLPGYGFSGKPTKPGWNPVTIAKAWATLMQRLGYTKYAAQGGDWGNAISEVMACYSSRQDCSAFTPTCGDGSTGCFRRRSLRVARHRRAFAGGKSTHGISSTTSIKTGWDMRTRCRCGRRRSTDSPIRQLGWRAGYSITTSAATR